MPKLRNILLLDDDEITNFIGTDVIISTGITETVTVSTVGQEALDLIEKNYEDAGKGLSNIPDIIFLDMNMPEMDGLEFLEKINPIIPQSGPFPMIIILSTAFVQDDITKAFAKSKLVKGYYEKPLTEEIINEVYLSYLKEAKEESGVRSQDDLLLAPDA